MDQQLAEMTSQCSQVAKKVLYWALIRLHLKYCIHFGAVNSEKSDSEVGELVKSNKAGKESRAQVL